MSSIGPRFTATLKLRAMAGGIVAMCSVLLGVDLWVQAKNHQSREDMTTVATAVRTHMQNDMMHDAIRGDVLSALFAGASKEEVLADFADHEATIRKGVAELNGASLSAETKAAISALDRPLDAYVVSAGKIVREHYGLGQTDRAKADVELAAFMPAFSSLEDAMEAAGDKVEGEGTAVAAAANQVERVASWMLLGTLFLAFLVLGGAAVWLSFSIPRPLLAATAAMRELAQGEGDLTARLPVTSNDEIGDLGIAFNEFISNLHGIVSQTRGVASHLSGAIVELGGATEQLSQGAQALASSVNETAASVDSLTQSVGESTRVATTARDVATDSLRVAEEGGRLIRSAVSSMDDVRKASKQIASITSKVNDIAFQTNLLALNAAVEAARAGAQGRGFAVVAAEVRNLAQSSAEAAKEIRTLIEDTVGKVESGAQRVQESGQSLDKIVEQVKKVESLIRQSAEVAESQVGNIRTVSLAMRQIDDVAQSTAAQTEQLTATTQSLASRAEELEDLTSRFKLERHGRHVEAHEVDSEPPRATSNKKHNAHDLHV